MNTKNIILIITILILFCWTIWLNCYQYLISREIQLHNQSLLERVNLTTTHEKNLNLQLKEILLKNEEYQSILSHSGKLHYIKISNDNWSWTKQTITDSYDIIRLHNTTEKIVSLTIYDSPNFSNSPLTTLEIQSGWILPFYLKQSGVYYFNNWDHIETIIIGRGSLDSYKIHSVMDKEILPILNKNDPNSIQKAMMYFKNVINTNPLISKECHKLAHNIGHKAFDMFGFSVAISQAADDICAGGYTHGILESYFLSSPKLADNPELVCSEIDENKKWSCFHWVGHGLMFLNKNNIAKSLDWCRMLSDSVWKNRCAEGVFMELYSGDLEHAGGAIWYNTGALFEPCTTYGSWSESYVCGYYAGLWYLRFADEDYIWALGACSWNMKYQNMCIGGLGKEIGKRYIWDALKLKSICSNLQDENQKNLCTKGWITYTKLQFETEPLLFEKYCLGFQEGKDICTNN